LMAREINRNEFFYYSKDDIRFENSDFYQPDEFKKLDWNVNKYKSYFSKLMNLALSASQKPKIKNPAFWITAASYCAFVDKNHKKSRELLENAKNLKPQNQSLQSQISLQDMMLLAKEYQMATPEMEQKLLPILSLLNERKNFRQSNAIVSTCKILAKMYDESIKKQMDFELASGGGWWSSCSKKKVKEDVWFSKSGIPFVRAKKTLFALLSTEKLAPKNRYHEINEYSKFVEDTTSAKYAKELLLFMEQPNPSEIDKKFISLLDKNYLTELLGRSYLREYNFAEAAKAFEQLPDSTWESGADEYYMDNYSYYLKRNPFFMGLYRESLADTSKRIPPAKFALKMDELSKKTDAESLYLLGCGTYNLSFWGNWWIMVHNGKSHSEITREPNYNINPQFINLNADYYQLRTAKRYFEQALSKTNDKELQARITYSLALIEQAKFEFEYAQKAPTYKDFKGNWEAYEAAREKYRTIMEKKEREFFNNFTILKTRYNQTKFHQLLIDECSTYEHFVSGK
jgi:hypothetical protein